MKKTLSTLLIGLALSPLVNAVDYGPLEQSQLSPEALANRGLQAGAIHTGLHSLCDVSKPLRMAGQRPKPSNNTQSEQPSKKPVRKRIPAEPMKVFDNLYFVGTGGVSSWAITTSEGIILIDALNNNRQAEAYIDKGLRKLGLDPAQIKYLIVAHGHGDHYGGQGYLVKNFGTRILMSDVDWEGLKSPEFNSPLWGKPPEKDIAIYDGDHLTLGETQVDFFVTPGHTMGTLTILFDVFDQGEQHRVALWGGTGLNFGPDVKRILTYSESAERMREQVQQQGVSIFMSNHPKRDGAMANMQRLSERTDGEAHAFVIGTQEAENAFTLLRDCSKAQALKVLERMQQASLH